MKTVGVERHATCVVFVGDGPLESHQVEESSLHRLRAEFWFTPFKLPLKFRCRDGVEVNV
jgi:hypothetical protein